MGIPGGGAAVKDISACGRGREMLYIDTNLCSHQSPPRIYYLNIVWSSHILGVTCWAMRGGGGTRTIDLNQTTDNVWSQIKDNCYELHWL